MHTGINTHTNTHIIYTHMHTGPKGDSAAGAYTHINTHTHT